MYNLFIRTYSQQTLVKSPIMKLELTIKTNSQTFLVAVIFSYFRRKPSEAVIEKCHRHFAAARFIGFSCNVQLQYYQLTG